MVVVRSSITTAGPSSPSTHTADTVSLPSTMPSLSNCNGQSKSSEGDITPTSYQKLLKQVECLKKENSTLKAELKSNSSHISKLENEASRMKDMVLKLGSPGRAAAGIESDNYLRQPFPFDENGLPFVSDQNSGSSQSRNHAPSVQSPLKLQNGLEQRETKSHRPEFLLGLAQMPQNLQYGPQPDSTLSVRHHHASMGHGAVSPSPTMTVADVIRKILLSLKAEKTNFLKTLNLEEQEKEYYLVQLKELTSRLDRVSESGKFAKPNDKTRQQLEIEIASMTKTMERSLGSAEVMQERLEARLKHIQFIESEIASLEQHLRKLEMAPTSPGSPLAAAHSQIGIKVDAGACSQHGSYYRNGVNFCVMSTQTPRLNGSELLKYDEAFSSSDDSVLNLPITSGSGRISRTVQTITSCLSCQSMGARNASMTPEALRIPPGQRDPSALRPEPKTPGSIDSPLFQSDMDETASTHSFTTSLPPHFQPSLGHMNDGLLSPSLLYADKDELKRRFLKMGGTVEGCRDMKQTGCIPLIMHIVHDGTLLSFPPTLTTPKTSGQINSNLSSSLISLKDTRTAMGQVLWKIVNVTMDAKSNLEIQIFNILECLRRYCEQLYDFWICSQTLRDHKKDHTKTKSTTSPVNGCFENGIDGNVGDVNAAVKNEKSYDFRAGFALVYEPPISGINAIRKLSFDESTKRIVNEFGGLCAVAEMFILHCRCIASAELVKLALGNDVPRHDGRNIQILRKFIGFSLINLTYGDSSNKTTLIQMPGLIDTIVAQMAADSEEIQQVMALFVRNLSWQPDEKCRDILRQKNVVAVFMKCALKSKKEDTLKSLLSALWNLSGHCPENRTNICLVKGSLAFVVSTLTYRVPEIIESGGGILQNISSVVAASEEYRKVLREKNCLQILLSHLKAASLTIVSNACGTLWNLSARNAQDQKILRDLGAVQMLRNLVHSKHSVISQGSNAALRNLLANKHTNFSAGTEFEKNESTKLKARKQKDTEMFESGKTPPDMEKFSPRQHVNSSAQEKMLLPRSILSPQRHSLQEKSSSSPVPVLDKAKRLQKGGLQYSGSLGSLPSTDISESFAKSRTGYKYVPTAGETNSYPGHYSSSGLTNYSGAGRNTVPPAQPSSYKSAFGPVGRGMLKDVMIFNDTAQGTGQMSLLKSDATSSPRADMLLRQYLKLIGERNMPQCSATASSPATAPRNTAASSKPHVSPDHDGAASNGRSPYYPTGLPPTAWGGSEIPVRVQPSGGAPKPVESPRIKNMLHPQPHGVQKLLNNSRNLSKVNSSLVPKCPEDLEKILHNVEDDYDNEDAPVNYSLQYRDEHMTPGIQSPRTDEIYEDAADESTSSPLKLPPPELRRNYMHTQMSGLPSASFNGPATKSDGGLSGLSSCIESIGSNGPPRQDGIKSVKNTALPMNDRNARSSISPVLQSGGVNFPGDRDPSKYDFTGYEDEKPTNFGAIYSEEQLYEPILHASMSLQPLCQTDILSPDATQQSIAADSSHCNEAPATEDRIGDTISETGEEHDKFNTGTFTPGHYYYHHRSGRNSGVMTPRTPLDDCTPLMFSRCSSLGSVSDAGSIHSSITSEPASRMMSGEVTPSHLPDSPSQSMPVSPRRSPPPIVVDPHPADVAYLERKQSSKAETKHNERFKPLTSLPSSLPPVAEAGKSSKPPLGLRIEDQVRKLEQPGYVSSMPHKDEVSLFHSEGSMSVMTKFSALTVDSSDKIQPISITNGSNQLSNLQSPVESNANRDENVQDKLLSTGGGFHEMNNNGEVRVLDETVRSSQRAILHAGYITSLPTNDEIKNFMSEGTLSVMTTFSEISCLKADNDGFHKGSGSVFSVSNSTISQRAGGSRSFASRSSATGASMPPPPPDKWNAAEGAASGQSMVKGQQQQNEVRPDVTIPTSLTVEEENEEDMDDSFPSSSSEDEQLLQRCIQQAIPKKPSKSSSRSTSKLSSKGSRSSRTKEKSPPQIANAASETPVKNDEDRSVTNPSPEVVAEKDKKKINIKQKIESANMKLKGVHIVDYIDNLINKSESTDEADAASIGASAKSKQVIDDAEKLQQSYSVRKKLKETEKQIDKPLSHEAAGHSQMSLAPVARNTALFPSEPTVSMQSKLRIQSYIKEGITSYALEGTPIEMSRSTSLSNITIDSEGHEFQDLNILENPLKTSRSVPDFQSVDTKAPYSEPLTNSTFQSAHARTASLAAPNRSSTGDKDSREILEVLGKQIESLSLTTVENVITSSKDPGYVRSLPHTDEIRKYQAEGSQFGGTEFSALTIDSETKIAPTVPTEIINIRPGNTTALTKSTDGTSPKHDSRPQNVPPSNELNTFPTGGSTELGPLRDETTVLENGRPLSWDCDPVPQPSSHYNDENDNLAMREEKCKYMIEDTPLNLSGPGSLSSLDFGSDDDNDLLTACITSALPPEKKTSNPPYPAQLLLAPQNHITADVLGGYSHRVPDGKVDSPTGQQMPLPISMHHQQYFLNPQMAGQGFSPDYHQSPTMEQFVVLQRGAEAMSAQLMQQSQYAQNCRIPVAHTPDMPLNSSSSLTQHTDGFFHHSRQTSTQDSDLSISSSVLGERQIYAGNARSPYSSGRQSRNPGSRQRFEKSSPRSKNQTQKCITSGKKFSPSQARDTSGTRRGRNTHHRARDSSSGSSSSYQRHHQRHRHMSGTNRSSELCNCQVTCSRPSAQNCYSHGPISASTSHIVDGVTSPPRPRRKSTNSASKNSLGGCEHNSRHHHHPLKPNRPRNSSKNVYRPSVVQLYPPLKDMVGVLEGVASVAARGDKVVADRPAQYSSNISKKSSSSSLVRSATFINERPSPILLENMNQEEKELYVAKSNGSLSSRTPQSQNSSCGISKARTSSPQGSSHSLRQNSQVPSRRDSADSLKAQSALSTKTKDETKSKNSKKATNQTQTKPKHKNVWSGIKKLLSPSEHPSSSSAKELNKNKVSQKKPTPKKSRPALKPSNKQAKQPSSATKITPNQKIQTNSQQALNRNFGESSSSSLSLSSSSVSSNSSDDDSPQQPANNTITPYGLLPKSPSVNSVLRRTVTNIPQSRSLGILSGHKPQNQAPTVWRKTPPKFENVNSNCKSSIAQPSTTSTHTITSERRTMTARGSEDVWIPKNAVNARSEYTAIGADVITSNNPLSGQNLQAAGKHPISQLNSPTVSGLQSPPRTQSPRVVQQVAPFNYKPSPREMQEQQSSTQSEKNVYHTKKISPDCKHTPV